MTDPRGIELRHSKPFAERLAATKAEFAALPEKERRALKRYLFPEDERMPKTFSDLPDWKREGLRGRFVAD